MAEVLANLQSPLWWFTVVIVGLLVNLAAAYTKPVLDVVASHWSLGRRARLEQQRADHRKRIEILRNDKHEQYLLLFAELRSALHALIGCVFAMIVIQFYAFVPAAWVPREKITPLALAFASGLIWNAYSRFRDAQRRMVLLIEADVYPRAIDRPPIPERSGPVKQ